MHTYWIISRIKYSSVISVCNLRDLTKEATFTEKISFCGFEANIVGVGVINRLKLYFYMAIKFLDIPLAYEFYIELFCIQSI